MTLELGKSWCSGTIEGTSGQGTGDTSLSLEECSASDLVWGAAANHLSQRDIQRDSGMPVCKAEAHRALELLEDYYARLDENEEKELKVAIERVIKIFKSRLFQALLDIQVQDEWTTNYFPADFIILLHFIDKGDLVSFTLG